MNKNTLKLENIKSNIVLDLRPNLWLSIYHSPYSILDDSTKRNFVLSLQNSLHSCLTFSLKLSLAQKRKQ
jgi:hypothetical protein